MEKTEYFFTLNSRIRKKMYRAELSYMGHREKTFPNGLVLYFRFRTQEVVYLYKGEIVKLEHRIAPRGYCVYGDSLYFSSISGDIEKHDLNTKKTSHVCKVDYPTGMTMPHIADVVGVGEHIVFMSDFYICDSNGRLLLSTDINTRKSTYELVAVNENFLIVAEKYTENTIHESSIAAIIHVLAVPSFNKVFESTDIKRRYYHNLIHGNIDKFRMDRDKATELLKSEIKESCIFLDQHSVIIYDTLVTVTNPNTDLPECCLCSGDIYSPPKLKFACTHPDLVCDKCVDKVYFCPLCRNTKLAKK